MDKIIYLFTANVVVWLGIGGYLIFLACAQKRLERRIKRLEALGADD